MNDFFEKLKKIFKEKPEYLEGKLEDFIYNQLIFHDLGKKDEAQKSVEDCFYGWDYKYNKNNKINNFKGGYFYYFRYNEQDILKDAIKLYIPMDSNHILEGVNQLFDFIIENNISHNSKVASKIRNDCVVVRVSNLDDAKKIIDFVKNNEYINEGLLNVNPFTLNINGVGLAKDSHFSYNDEIAKSIANLIKILNEKDRLDSLNVDTFILYLEQLKDDNLFLSELHKLQLAVIKNKNLSFDELENNIYTKLADKEELLRDIIILQYRKKGITETMSAIKQFILDEDIDNFVNIDGCNKKIKYNFTSNDIKQMLINNGMSLEEYVDYLLEDVSEIKILENAYKETLKKYGAEQAKTAILQYIADGDDGYITSENDARHNVRNNIDYDNIDEIIYGWSNTRDIDVISLASQFCDELEKKYTSMIKK